MKEGGAKRLAMMAQLAQLCLSLCGPTLSMSPLARLCFVCCGAGPSMDHRWQPGPPKGRRSLRNLCQMLDWARPGPD